MKKNESETKTKSKFYEILKKRASIIGKFFKTNWVYIVVGTVIAIALWSLIGL